ncbi:MAG: hypothetical protein OXC31_24865 [Spirochaetaceae bacterium]|nr:hypothetical protein [Spirochaetaceae bacterium]
MRALAEYEEAGAHRETVRFKNEDDFSRFEELAENNDDTISVMQELGYHHASKKVILNTISMAMISDCLHHIYEALTCFEKRKSIVGFNLLRKPLKENLLYLSWMHGRRDEFYCQFMQGDSKYLSQSKIGADRRGIYSDAIQQMPQGDVFDAERIESLIYDRSDRYGFELFFQHAVHLVTIRYPELRTEPENFNFIFKDPRDDDLYEVIYSNLPYLMLFMSHVVMGVFHQMRAMDETSRTLFRIRSMLAYSLIVFPEDDDVLQRFHKTIRDLPRCRNCNRECKLTPYNLSQMLFRAVFRCTYCRKKNPFVFFLLPEYEYAFEEDSPG